MFEARREGRDPKAAKRRLRAEAVSLWAPLWLLGAYLYLELMRRFSELAPRLGEASYDVAIYRRAGEAILAGKAPYRDFFIEYPPGSLPVFVPPALFSSSREGYASLFASEMALALVAAPQLTACAARSLGRPWPLFPAAVFAAGAILLYPVAVTRYGAVVALTLAATIALSSSSAFGRNSAVGASASVAAWASLGFGAATKIVSALLTLPLALLAGRGEQTLSAVVRSAAGGFAVFFGVVAVFLLPALLLGGGDFSKTFSYHADRGLQLVSLGSSVLLKLAYVERVFLEFGTYDVQGRGGIS
jgi:Glycosyltransferase family 87